MNIITSIVIAYSILTTNVSAVEPVEYATVISVIEITETKTSPTQVCNNVSVPIYGPPPTKGGAVGSIIDRTFGSTRGLVGAITGGYIGSHIGNGSGKRLATIAGTAVGTQIGDGYANKEPQIIGYKNSHQCQQAFTANNEISGYHVLYDYKGKTLSKFVRYRPVLGSKYQVDLSIR